MGVNSLPETVTRQRRDCDLNHGPSVPESRTLTTRLPSHPELSNNIDDYRLHAENSPYFTMGREMPPPKLPLSLAGGDAAPHQIRGSFPRSVHTPNGISGGSGVSQQQLTVVISRQTNRLTRRQTDTQTDHALQRLHSDAA